ncbi:hypothetical protein MRX96_004050 [Rhipicephalus microplus]
MGGCVTRDHALSLLLSTAYLNVQYSSYDHRFRYRIKIAMFRRKIARTDSSAHFRKPSSSVAHCPRITGGGTCRQATTIFLPLQESAQLPAGAFCCERTSRRSRYMCRAFAYDRLSGASPK